MKTVEEFNQEQHAIHEQSQEIRKEMRTVMIALRGAEMSLRHLKQAASESVEADFYNDEIVREEAAIARFNVKIEELKARDEELKQQIIALRDEFRAESQAAIAAQQARLAEQQAQQG